MVKPKSLVYSPKIQQTKDKLKVAVAVFEQTKILVTCQRFGDLFLFGLVWQYASVQTKYNKGRFTVDSINEYGI